MHLHVELKDTHTCRGRCQSREAAKTTTDEHDHENEIGVIE